MSATIKINGIPIRKGYTAFYRDWYYGVEEYYAQFNQRRGMSVYASKTYTFGRRNSEGKVGAYILLTRDASGFCHRATTWRVTIFILGLDFSENNLSLPKAFAKVKEWITKLDSATV